MNNDNFLIEEIDIELARNICKYIENVDTRNRAVASALAANIAEKYFTEVEVDTKTGIHNIGKVLEDVEIADIYVNGSYIDVRFYFEGEPLTIPQNLYDNEIRPVAYMFIKLQEDISGGLVTGFVQSEAVSTENVDNGYYVMSEEDLVSFYDIQPLLITADSVELPEDFSKQVFDYLDNRLDNSIDFYKLLLSSEEAREELATKANVKDIFRFVSFVSSNTNAELSSVAASDLDLSEDLVNISSNDEIESLSEFGEPVDLMSVDDDANVLEIYDDNTEDFDIQSEELISSNTQLEEADLEKTIEERDDVEDLLVEDSGDSEIVELEFSGDVEDLQLDENNSLASISEQIPESSLNEEVEIEDIEDSSAIDVESSNEALPMEETLEVAIDEHDNPETSGFNFSTSVTPSLDEIESTEILGEAIVTNLDEQGLQTDELMQDLNHTDESSYSLDDKDTVIQENSGNASSVDAEQIDTLFDDDEIPVVSTSNKSKNPLFGVIIAILILLAGLGCAGYFGYTKLVESGLLPDLLNNNPVTNDSYVQEELPQPVEVPKVEEVQPIAMPNETIENVKEPAQTNEGTSVSIPVIEQNLDANIQVANLTVNWEVPASYVSNATIKRYFTKLGKIIQLRLKTELLLLTKQPMSNKIAVELQFNKDKNSFEVKGMVTSSGDKTVDDLVVDTISKVLDMNLKVNTNSFKTLAGNPVLVIKL